MAKDAWLLLPLALIANFAEVSIGKFGGQKGIVVVQHSTVTQLNRAHSIPTVGLSTRPSTSCFRLAERRRQTSELVPVCMRLQEKSVFPIAMSHELDEP